MTTDKSHLEQCSNTLTGLIFTNKPETLTKSNNLTSLIIILLILCQRTVQQSIQQHNQQDKHASVFIPRTKQEELVQTGIMYHPLMIWTLSLMKLFLCEG